MRLPRRNNSDFNPRPPCGGRQEGETTVRHTDAFQSTSSVWRTTCPSMLSSCCLWLISIHVLRVEDDRSKPDYYTDRKKFQSTSSVWRTTLPMIVGARPWAISIHVLRVEDDLYGTMTCAGNCAFQSTSSVWRTTGRKWLHDQAIVISIHVLRVEDDQNPTTIGGVSLHFNPRPPCGGRLVRSLLNMGFDGFQSTSSVWRTTLRISNSTRSLSNFNPRPPCGGRRGILGAKEMMA